MAYHKIQKLREQKGLKTPNRTLHIAFLGNPGTGKTTVARIIGKMYKQLGILSKGHFIEVSRTDLIAGYQGQTALKVKQVIDKAKGGVLFIDEAYSLTENDHSDSYGRECLTELTKALEDYRKDLVVIVAGYTDLMKEFFDSNPGLQSRFNTFIEFNDYQASELVNIFVTMTQHDDYEISDNAKSILSDIIEKQVSEKTDKFANGRYVRNLYEDVIMNQARRLSKSQDIRFENLRLLTPDDFLLTN
jgi:SpoVK/Ycf46/Vps4 family AAA+-type ATPase